MSANTCDPPETATRDAEPPTSATTDPSIDNLCVASTAKRSVTARATRRKVSFSHVRMKTMPHHAPRVQGCKKVEP